MALAWPGLALLPPAGGEGQSLQQQQQLGLWVIAGILTFLVLEKMFLDSKEEGTSQAPSKDPTAAAAALNGGHCLAQPAAEPGLGAMVRSIKVSGYLNLLANTIDNFTHGLAVAASFLVSKKALVPSSLLLSWMLPFFDPEPLVCFCSQHSLLGASIKLLGMAPACF
ncbi:hypothetical protein P7K49_021822 [Saguinus oedipus]|uniref:Uncharacterized protein n=1 Tax=Saguinus oedipus TaxID=9490 RepID=A0ABQ9UTQ2_SAGOE|nr:hypothetical protein P7K49_021822 [Saguinus oedipus]